jgi:soluble lytic murein transglycosylase-like protein
VIYTQGQITELIRRECEDVGVDTALALAIAKCESAFNPAAIRFEAHWRYFNAPHKWAAKLYITEATEKQLQMFSFGVFQLMGGTARDIGYDGPLVALLEPTPGVVWGVKNIKRLAEKYESEEHLIAAYNAGTPRRDARTGEFMNQIYVNRVKDALKKYRGFSA